MCVSVRMLGRGTPLPSAELCVAQPQDTTQEEVTYNERVRNYSARVCVCAYMYECMCVCLKCCPQVPRPVVGYVSAGGFSLIRGCGYGIGFVNATLWMKVLADNARYSLLSHFSCLLSHCFCLLSHCSCLLSLTL